MFSQIRARSQRFVAAIVTVIGPEECAIYAALALIAVGCWHVWRPGSYLIPGGVMLWMYLPQRAAFIARPPEKREPRAR